ncbi:methionine ABC transporter ATP-binding protein [Methylococcus sp. EFPC2]|uniref:methionine ABC transporter ATP-binding protein n=1 Tax=Methylococcus sp. EFPC2 TaxID=2812648 RepID=UPI0019672FB0|nr:ATP-binding cassette domain-containing protein [Methylococcus sp. EFPC2]QSA95817.1 ATP-binding cassette domain-containing protein [Methylococcus sp. EFPC2]
MIRIENLHKTYRVDGREICALNGIDLHIGEGEIFGIIGRSGAGKSTLIRSLNLLERPSAGRVLIAGEDITQFDHHRLYALRRRTGMIFQHFNLLNAKTVADNIAWPLKATGRHTAAQRAARVAELLDLVGLADQGGKYPAQLSGGQKQRVGIARALANHPQLLLCDEATSALDPETTQSILKLLLDINRQLGLTIVLITHEMQVIRTLCDRVAVIEAGRIVECGTVAEVFLHPRHPVTRSLVTQSDPLIAATPAPFPAYPSDKPRGTRVRLTYLGDVVYQPILSHLAAATPARITLLQGEVSTIKDVPFGQLLLELQGSTDEIGRVYAELDRLQIHREVLL